MLAVTRFRVSDDEATSFPTQMRDALDVLRSKPGFVDGRVGRNADDPTLWVLVTQWENMGTYRRAISSYELRATAMPLLAKAVDEPGAYELVAV